MFLSLCNAYISWKASQRNLNVQRLLEESCGGKSSVVIGESSDRGVGAGARIRPLNKYLHQKTGLVKEVIHQDQNWRLFSVIPKQKIDVEEWELLDSADLTDGWGDAQTYYVLLELEVCSTTITPIFQDDITWVEKMGRPRLLKVGPTNALILETTLKRLFDMAVAMLDNKLLLEDGLKIRKFFTLEVQGIPKYRSEECIRCGLPQNYGFGFYDKLKSVVNRQPESASTAGRTYCQCPPDPGCLSPFCPSPSLLFNSLALQFSIISASGKHMFSSLPPTRRNSMGYIFDNSEESKDPFPTLMTSSSSVHEALTHQPYSQMPLSQDERTEKPGASVTYTTLFDNHSSEGSVIDNSSISEESNQGDLGVGSKKLTVTEGLLRRKSTEESTSESSGSNSVSSVVNTAELLGDSRLVRVDANVEDAQLSDDQADIHEVLPDDSSTQKVYSLLDLDLDNDSLSRGSSETDLLLHSYHRLRNEEDEENERAYDEVAKEVQGIMPNGWLPNAKLERDRTDVGHQTSNNMEEHNKLGTWSEDFNRHKSIKLLLDNEDNQAIEKENREIKMDETVNESVLDNTTKFEDMSGKSLPKIDKDSQFTPLKNGEQQRHDAEEDRLVSDHEVETNRRTTADKQSDLFVKEKLIETDEDEEQQRITSSFMEKFQQISQEMDCLVKSCMEVEKEVNAEEVDVKKYEEVDMEVAVEKEVNAEEVDVKKYEEVDMEVDVEIKKHEEVNVEVKRQEEVQVDIKKHEKVDKEVELRKEADLDIMKRGVVEMSVQRSTIKPELACKVISVGVGYERENHIQAEGEAVMKESVGTQVISCEDSGGEYDVADSSPRQQTDSRSRPESSASETANASTLVCENEFSSTEDVSLLSKTEDLIDVPMPWSECGGTDSSLPSTPLPPLKESEEPVVKKRKPKLVRGIFERSRMNMTTQTDINSEASPSPVEQGDLFSLLDIRQKNMTCQTSFENKPVLTRSAVSSPSSMTSSQVIEVCSAGTQTECSSTLAINDSCVNTSTDPDFISYLNYSKKDRKVAKTQKAFEISKPPFNPVFVQGGFASNMLRNSLKGGLKGSSCAYIAVVMPEESGQYFGANMSKSRSLEDILSLSCKELYANQTREFAKWVSTKNLHSSSNPETKPTHVDKKKATRVLQGTRSDVLSSLDENRSNAEDTTDSPKPADQPKPKKSDARNKCRSLVNLADDPHLNATPEKDQVKKRSKSFRKKKSSGDLNYDSHRKLAGSRRWQSFRSERRRRLKGLPDMKPPNILIYTSEGNCLNAAKRVLSSCINTERYAIYDLKDDEIEHSPWFDNTCLLVVVGKVKPSKAQHIKNYLTEGGAILCMCSDLVLSILPGAHTTEMQEDALVQVTFDGWKTKLIHDVRHYSCAQTPSSRSFSTSTSGGDNSVTEMKVEVLATDDTWHRPVLFQVSTPSGGIAVISQVHLELEPSDYAHNTELYSILKEQNSSRLGILKKVLESYLHVDCTITSVPSLTPAYLIAQPSEAEDFMNRCRGVSERRDNVTLRFQLKDGVLPEPTAQFLPVITDDLPKSFDHTIYEKHLKTKQLGRVLLYSDVMGSTMNVLKGVSLGHGTTVVAKVQTKGKGRGGNVWISPLGCLMFSVQLIFPVSSQLGQRFSLLQHIASLAALQAMQRNTPYQKLGVKLKWPNDIYLGDHTKIGGVLVDATMCGRDLIANVGVGINVTNSKPTVCINDAIREHNESSEEHLQLLTLEEVLARTLRNLEKLISLIEEEGTTAFIPQYIQHWIHSGKKVHVEKDGEKIPVVVTGIDEWGYLVVETASGVQITVHPDGNSFDMTHGLVVPKVERDS